jgi:hypothetical protein
MRALCLPTTQKHAQSNTVLVQQEKVDRVVEFEPTTSAMPFVVRKELAQFLLGSPLAHLALSDAIIITEEEGGYFSSR